MSVYQFQVKANDSIPGPQLNPPFSLTGVFDIPLREAAKSAKCCESISVLYSQGGRGEGGGGEYTLMPLKALTLSNLLSGLTI